MNNGHESAPQRRLAMTMRGITPAAFLARDWQRRARLFRAAVSAASALVSRDELFRLAARDDVESRIVRRDRGRWALAHGPFSARTLRAMPPRDWTLLVQGVNHHVPALDRLLASFAFVPYARLDDIMVSYAAPGGGVGPHFDSYDVFLLQALGRRRWRTSTQRDLALRPGLPVKILARFAWRDEHLLAPGDMLYLPPRVAHDGVAIDECITCSIGFRAPAAGEIARELLGALADASGDALPLPGRYADPGLRPTRSPGALPPALVEYAAATLARVRLDARALAPLVGTMLSTPKPHVVFTPPSAPRSRPRFGQAIARRDVRLDPRTILLYDRTRFFINGESERPAATERPILRRLADRRMLAPLSRAPAALIDRLYGWYRAGFLHIDDER